MLKNILLVIFAFMTVTLNTACPRDIANSIVEEDKLTKEYDNKANESNDMAVDFLVTYGLSTADKPTAKDWESMPSDKRKVLKGKLSRYLEIVGRLIELAKHKNVKPRVKAGEEAKLQNSQKIVAIYLQAVEKCEAEGKCK